MPTITERFADTYRDFVTEGVPGSGKHEPPKSDIRAIGAAIDNEKAVAANSLVGVNALSIPAPVMFFRTSGHYAAGDGGGAGYKRAPAEPDHPFWKQSADGAYWELVPDGGVILLPQIGVFPTTYAPATYSTEGVLEPEARDLFDGAPADHKPGWYTLWQISKLIQRMKTTLQTGTSNSFWTLLGGAAGVTWEEVGGSWQLVVVEPPFTPTEGDDGETGEDDEEEGEEDEDVLSDYDTQRYATITTAYREAVATIGTDYAISAEEMDAEPVATAAENHTRLQAAADWAAGRFKVYAPGARGVYNHRGEIKLPSFSSWAADHERSIFRMANDTARDLNNFTNETNDRTEANPGNRKITVIGLSADGNTANRTGSSGTATSGNCFGWANVKDVDAQYLWGFDAPKHCHDIAGSTYNSTSATITGAANNGSGLIRLTVDSTAGYETGDVGLVRGVQGTTEANSTSPATYWTLTVVDGTHIDLQGSTFVNAFTSSPGAYIVREATPEQLSAGSTSGVFLRLKANFGGDDLITTHHCEHVTLYSPHCEFNVNFGNGNGLEIDDGSRYVAVYDLFSRMCTNGLEIKAHGSSVAPYQVRIHGSTLVSNRSTAIEMHHSSPWNAAMPSPTAENVIISDTTVRDARGAVLSVNDYSGWLIDGLSIVDPPAVASDLPALIFIRRGVERGELRNVRAKGYNKAVNLISCTSWGAAGNIAFRNITAINTGTKRVIYIGSSPRNITIENIEGTAESGEITMLADSVVVEFLNVPGAQTINGSVRGIINNGYAHHLDAGAMGFFDYDVEITPRHIVRGGGAGPVDDTYDVWREVLGVQARSGGNVNTTPRKGTLKYIREGNQDLGAGEGVIDAHGIWLDGTTEIKPVVWRQSYKLSSTDSSYSYEWQDWTIGIGDDGVGYQRTAWGQHSKVFGPLSAGISGSSSVDYGAWFTAAAATTARASLRVVDGVDPTSPADGAIWKVGSDLKARLNGVTYVLANKAYVDALLAAQDAMVFKGSIDCSANPNYPAADRGHTYRVSVAGKIGGASGVNVEAGDLLICITDATATGTQAAVGSNWSITQTNIDGAVVGPASATANHFAQFDGTTGKLIKGGLALTTSTTLAGNSDTNVPSEKAVKAYAFGLAVEDQSISGGAVVVSKSLGTVTTGTLTPDPGDRPMQHYTNDGAHTLAPGTKVGSYYLKITNGASAGTITTSGWTIVRGDPFTTTNGHKFGCECVIDVHGDSILTIAAYP